MNIIKVLKNNILSVFHVTRIIGNLLMYLNINPPVASTLVESPHIKQCTAAMISVYPS